MASRNRSREAAGGSAGPGPRDGARDARGGPPARVAAPARHCARRRPGADPRPRRTPPRHGFVADHHGTVVTSHEAVDGLCPAGPARRRGTAAAWSAADRRDPAARTRPGPRPHRGPGRRDPLPVTVRDRIEAGTYVRIAAGGWREARVLGTTARDLHGRRTASISSTTRWNWRSARPAATRCGSAAARPAGPCVDAATGAVLGVLGTALQLRATRRRLRRPAAPPGATARWPSCSPRTRRRSRPTAPTSTSRGCCS